MCPPPNFPPGNRGEVHTQGSAAASAVSLPKSRNAEIGAFLALNHIRGALTLFGLALVVFIAGVVTAHAQQSAPFEQILNKLPDASYAEKSQLIKELVQLRHAATKEVLNALLEGNLYVRTADHKVLIGAAADDQYKLKDPATGADAGVAGEDALQKVGVNNQLRKALRAALAQFELSDPAPAVRIAAIKEMQRSIDAETVVILRERLQQERDASVRAELSATLALADLQTGDKAKRIAAIQELKGRINPDVYNHLSALLEKNPDGSFTEPDEDVRIAAGGAVRTIESWRRFYGGVETLFFGLSLGSVLVLSAIGLAITFGVMGVINMAHGELMMLGAYTTYVIQLLMPNHLAISIIVAIPAAFLIAGAMGVLIERCVVRFLYGRALETLLATFGLSLILQQLVRSVFSPLNRSVATPDWMSGSWQINEALSITSNRLYIVAFTLAIFIALQAVLKKTTLGLNVRAVSQNRRMAKAMGIRTEWVDALTFGLGSGIAGLAGVALSQLTNVGPNLGQSYIIDSFMVVVFGGVGNLWGTLIGGMSLGVVNKLLEPYAGAVLAKILVLVCLILFIQRRPRGLFPQKGRAAEGH